MARRVHIWSLVSAEIFIGVEVNLATAKVTKSFKNYDVFAKIQVQHRKKVAVLDFSKLE